MKRILPPIAAFALVLLAAFPLHARDSYKKTLKQHTRSDEVYWTQNLHAAILWHATRLDDAMLEAMAAKNAKIYERSAPERERVLDELRERRGQGSWFFISFYFGDRHFADLLNSRAGWELTLESGGRAYSPSQIEKNKRHTPLDYAYFPYLNQWSTGYYVWFPAPSGGHSPATLEIHGPQARSKLTWD